LSFANLSIKHEFDPYNLSSILRAYCALFLRNQQTLYICGHPECNLPFCSVGTGKAEEDYFALSHLTAEIRLMTIKKNHVLLQRTNNDKK
jgi:hypothetical protein